MESTFDNDFTDDSDLPTLGIEEESMMIPDAMTASMEADTGEAEEEAGQQETFNDYG